MNRTQLTSLEISKGKNKIIPTQFDEKVWQLYFDATQEPMLKFLTELSNDYFKSKSEYNLAPPERKKMLHARLKRKEKIIRALDESYKAGSDYLRSMCISFHVEFKRLETAKNIEIDEAYKAYEFAIDISIKLLDSGISSQQTKIQ